MSKRKTLVFSETESRIESLDLLGIMLDRYTKLGISTQYDDTIKAYKHMPDIYKVQINKLIRRVYFGTQNINDSSIIKVISNKEYMKTIIRVIECQFEYMKKLEITDEFVNSAYNDDLINKSINMDNLDVQTCWLCNNTHHYLKLSDKNVLCFGCGRYYYKGNEIKKENKNIETSRIRKK